MWYDLYFLCRIHSSTILNENEAARLLRCVVVEMRFYEDGEMGQGNCRLVSRGQGNGKVEDFF